MKKSVWIAIAAVSAVLLVVAGILFLLPQLNQPTRVGICYRSGEDLSGTQYHQSLEAALKAKGYELIVEDADNDQARQIEKIALLAERECDLLIVEPVMVTAAQELSAAINGTGLPVVLIGRQPDRSLLDECAQACYVGGETVAVGTLQGQMALALPQQGDINGDGVVSYIVIQGPEDHLDALAATESCAASLEADCQCHRLSLSCGDWTYESGRQLCASQLAAYGKDIEVIFCGSDEMALGAIEAIADGGRTVGTDVYLFGAGGSQEALQSIQAGTMSGTVSMNYEVQVQKVMEAVNAMLQQQSVQKQYIIQYTPVTAGEEE